MAVGQSIPTSDLAHERLHKGWLERPVHTHDHRADNDHSGLRHIGIDFEEYGNHSDRHPEHQVAGEVYVLEGCEAGEEYIYQEAERHNQSGNPAILREQCVHTHPTPGFRFNSEGGLKDGCEIQQCAHNNTCALSHYEKPNNCLQGSEYRIAEILSLSNQSDKGD